MWYTCVRVGLRAAEYVIDELCRTTHSHDGGEELAKFVPGRKETYILAAEMWECVSATPSEGT
jgi:hypothetical protein